jgi:pimeloyl-ACP methyl ester carboxylesterase
MKAVPKLFVVVLLIFSQTIFAQQNDSIQFYTSFDGIKIHYETNGNGTPVILLHGFTGTIQSWKNTLLYADLLKAGFQVIVPDMRGNGLSDKPHTPEAYEQDAEAKDIMGLATKLKLNSYYVVGYSRGSIIASRLLVLDKRVSKCVLGGMGSDFMNPEWPRRIMFYKALIGEPMPELEGFLKYVNESGFDQLALAYLQKSQPFTSAKEFSIVKKPVLVICGDRDEDNGSSKELAALIPKSAYKRVPGDHNSTSKTQAFSYEVIAFLKKKI